MEKCHFRPRSRDPLRSRVVPTCRAVRHSLPTVRTNGYGSTSAASVPLAFDVAVRDGRIQRGQTVLMEAFGGGFTWGSALLKY